MPTRSKDACPSCFQPITPTDFLCPHCELILDASQMPDHPGTSEVSVVRRMLEPPQRGIPAAVPDKKKGFRNNKSEGADGPTRKLDLGPELAGVPIVVASLSKRSESLTELEAWLVSLIDGQSDAQALADKAAMREFELRVMLRTLNAKQIIDFADQPLTDEAFELPAVGSTLEVPEEDEPVSFAPPAVAAPPPPAVPPGPAAPSYGANADRRDSRFVAPPSRQPAPAPAFVVPPPPPARQAAPPPPPPPSPPVTAPPPPPVVARHPPKRAEVAPPFPASSESQPVVTPKSVFQSPSQPPPSFVPTPMSGARAVEKAEPPKERHTDPRIAYTGTPNRKLLDALKQVKRVDGGRNQTASRETDGAQPIADVLARDSLQIALRMEQGGRMDEAIRFLEKSIAQSPDAASLYNRLGLILMRERADYQRAEQLIRKANELAPDNTVYSTNLKQVVSRLALKSAR